MDDYSYPEVLGLSWDEIEALDIAEHERRNIQLRKYANELPKGEREVLVRTMIDLFTSPYTDDKQFKNRRDTVSRWLSTNPGTGKSRRDFYTSTGSRTMLPNSYDATVRLGGRNGPPQSGKNYGEKNLTVEDRIQLRDRFIQGLINNQEDSTRPKESKTERTLTDLEGLQKDRVIQYLREDSLWENDLSVKFTLGGADFSFNISFFSDSPQGRSPEGVSAELFNGLFED